MGKDLEMKSVMMFLNRTDPKERVCTRPVTTLRTRDILVPLATLAILTLVVGGCGTGTNGSVDMGQNSARSYIMGEVVQIAKATPAEAAKGMLGLVDVEGSRSQKIPEALLTITKSTRILDEHGGAGSSATFDTIKERQTIEAWFDLRSENPWKAIASKVIISP
jgi:hypothetical protein